MRSLFLRIFISFWIIQSVMLAIAVFHEPMHPEGIRSHFTARIQSSVLTASRLAILEYEDDGPEGYLHTIAQFQQDSRIPIWVIDPEGHELGGRLVPPEIRQQRNREDLKMVVDTSSGRYTAFADIPESLIPPIQRDPVWHTLLAMAVSGLVCYWLARYLTRPIDNLRRAAQSMAQGDLSARAKPSSGRDEISQLVSDFNIMADRLQTTINAQKQLVSDISHELRSPLARLTVALELARARAGEEAGSALNRIELESARLNDMIGRILALAQLTAGDLHMEKQRTRVSDVLRDTVGDADFEARAKSTRVEFRIDEEAEAAEVDAYPALLRSAFENVIRNAIAYTAPGTPVEVGECYADGCVNVSVRDHGAGVPEQDLSKLFLPFYRVDNSRTRGTGGTGLGLAIASRAVTLHGGTIHAENAPDGGLVVKIAVPAKLALVPQPA